MSPRQGDISQAAGLIASLAISGQASLSPSIRDGKTTYLSAGDKYYFLSDEETLTLAADLIAVAEKAELIRQLAHDLENVVWPEQNDKKTALERLRRIREEI